MKKTTTLKQKTTEFLDDIFLYPFEVKEVMSTLSQSQGWHITQLNIPETWKVTRGDDITVMVIDTGYTEHPDLIGAMNESLSKSFLSSEPSIEDLNGHSSHVSGIIGARDNSTGMVGVAPECKIFTAKVLGKNGSGSFESIREALLYAKKIKPDVINMSLGSHYYDPEMHKIIKDLYKMNIPIIAASGNDSRGNAVNYPAKYPEVICVTAFDENGKPARFNSTGPEAEFSAPGVDIYSTWIKHRYVKISGTSMATPFVAGIVALLLSKHKKQEAKTGQNDCRNVNQIREHLIKYSDDKGVVGRDNTWGYGVIDAVKVITKLDSEEVTPIPTTTVRPNPKRRGFWSRWKSFWKKIVT